MQITTRPTVSAVLELMAAKRRAGEWASAGRESPATIAYYGNGGGGGFGQEFFGVRVGA